MPEARLNILNGYRLAQSGPITHICITFAAMTHQTVGLHMTTLKLFSAQNISVPASTSWYLADLGEFRGKQELFTQQSPQR
ncbi:MAG: hypothetical protein Q7S58_08130, partial [Candidatus Binatus sp.]